jgi:hypothetical protein
MIPYFGGHPTKQFIRGKPVRFGYKIWALCTPDGYMINMEPYIGTGGNVAYNRDLGLGGSVIDYFASILPNDISFHMYTDRFFSRYTDPTNKQKDLDL